MSLPAVSRAGSGSVNGLFERESGSSGTRDPWDHLAESGADLADIDEPSSGVVHTEQERPDPAAAPPPPGRVPAQDDTLRSLDLDLPPVLRPPTRWYGLLRRFAITPSSCCLAPRSLRQPRGGSESLGSRLRTTAESASESRSTRATPGASSALCTAL